MAPSTPYLSDLTRRFRAARAYAGIRLKDAAEELGTSERTLQRIEKGVNPVPPTYIAWAISRWQIPSWLLPGDASSPAAPDDAARQLADFSQRELDRDEREHPEEPGVGEGSS